MTCFIAKVDIEELKMFLKANSRKEIKQKLDKLRMVIRAIHPNFDNIRDQIFTSQEIPSMESLTT